MSKEYYRILTALRITKEPSWSLHWCMPTTLEQAKKDLENLKKNEKNPLVIYKLVKITEL
jgi:hypothetical protein